MFEIIWHLRAYIRTFGALIFRPLAFYQWFYDVSKQDKTETSPANKADVTHSGYLGPLKFAIIGISISAFILTPAIKLGLATGAYHPVYGMMLQWAEQEGISGKIEFVGIGFIDGIILEFLLSSIFFIFGLSLWVTSGQKIPIRFASGYFLYFPAWVVLNTMTHFGFLVLSMIYPIFQTGLPQLVAEAINLALLFMAVGFPIIFWPRILNVKRKTVTIALAISLAAWLPILLILDVLIM